MEAATKANLVAEIDEAGKLDEEIKTKTARLKELKEGIKINTKGEDDNGAALKVDGNIYSATVSFVPEFKELEDIQVEIDPLDGEQGIKLVPWDVVEPHKEFTGDQDAVNELKNLVESKLFNSLFKHVPGRKDRVPHEGELAKMARSDVKKNQEVRAVVLEYVKEFHPNTVNLKAND